jgi:hypothetical protein
MIPHDRNMSVWKMQGLHLHALAERAKLTMELDISSQEGSPEFQYEMHAATGDAKAAGRATAERARRAMLIIQRWIRHPNASFDPCQAKKSDGRACGAYAGSSCGGSQRSGACQLSAS